MNHHRVAVAKQFVQFLTTFGILLYNFNVHVVGRCQCSAHSGLSAAHHNHVLYVGIMLLTYNLAYIRYILLGGHKVG